MADHNNHLPAWVRTRMGRVTLALLFAMLLEGLLVWTFTRIPKARTYVPLRIVHSEAAYDWSPAGAPRWFHTDDPGIPESAYFREAITSQWDGSPQGFEQQLAIMNWVRQQVVVEDASTSIDGDPISVHQSMLAGTPAQCGNFATLYATTSASLGLTNVRLWFMISSDGPNEQGHALNEVWVPELDKWVLVDPMNNAYVLVDGVPGSLLEVRAAVLNGQRDQLEFVMGPNGHTPPEKMFELYEITMPIVSMETTHTPLRNFYHQTWGDKIAASLPDVANLPLLFDRAYVLFSGEVWQVTLIDDLARQHMPARLPIFDAKATFWAMVVNFVGMLGLSVALLWVAAKAIVVKRKTGG